MNAIVVNLLRPSLAASLSAAGYGVTETRLDVIVRQLRDNIDAFAIADVIVLDGRYEQFGDLMTTEYFSRAYRAALDLRQLPDRCVMTDGRRWNGLPIAIVVNDSARFLLPNDAARAVNVSPPRNLSVVATFCDDLIRSYRDALLAEYEDHGFLITEENGRLRLRPALTSRPSVETRLYAPSADRRDRSKWITVDRDAIGITYEAERFEALINNPNVSESDLHKFFEEHPHFLTTRIWSKAISHPRLGNNIDPLLIPDFVLEPIVAEGQPRDSQWQLLELKRPQDRIMVGSAQRRMLSHALQKAIAQLRQYRTYFENPQNAAAVAAALGKAIRRPQLAVLIGRSETLDADALDEAQERERVSIVTYDQILDRQIALLRRTAL